MFAASTHLAAAQEARGWAGTAALVLAVAAYLAVVHSPTLLRVAVSGVKHLVGRGVTTPDTDDDTTPDTGTEEYGWGRIGRDTARSAPDTDDTDRDTTSRWGRLTHIWRTGASPPTPDGDEQEEVIEPDEIIAPTEKPETLEEFLQRADGKMPYMNMVREIQDRYQVSEATAKRRIREARGARTE